MELILVRHTSVDVPQGLCYGQSDVPLKASFEQEAAGVRENLARIAGPHPFDGVYTSPLSRCTRLAAWCGYADAVRDDRLMEMNFGAWELQSWETLPEAETKAWFANWTEMPVPGGESFLNQRARMACFLDELQASSLGRVLVFCHGGIIACAHSLCGGVPLHEVFREHAPYGAVIRFEK